MFTRPGNGFRWEYFVRNIISNSMERLGKSSNYMVDFHMIGVEKGQHLHHLQFEWMLLNFK
jgi:hypothetical protein